MKDFVNMFLLALLVVLMYNNVRIIDDSVKSKLGKLMWMVVIYVVISMYDQLSGLLLALIFVLLLNNQVENFENALSLEEKEEMILPERLSTLNITDLDRNIKIKAEHNKQSCTSE